MKNIWKSNVSKRVPKNFNMKLIFERLRAHVGIHAQGINALFVNIFQERKGSFQNLTQRDWKVSEGYFL
jgi:hypothetical protein